MESCRQEILKSRLAQMEIPAVFHVTDDGMLFKLKGKFYRTVSIDSQTSDAICVRELGHGSYKEDLQAQIR